MAIPEYIDIATRIKLQLGGMKNISPRYTKEQLKELSIIADFVIGDYLRKARAGRAGRKRKDDSAIQQESLKIRHKRQDKRLSEVSELEQLTKDLKHLIAIK